MLRRSSKPLPLYLIQSLTHHHPLSKLHTKSYYRPRSKDANEEDDNEKKGQERQLYFYKSKGQHILTNPRVLDAIVRKSNIKPTDTVLEIGPGTGNLTLKLLEAAGKVVAFEVDRRMVEVLNKRVADGGFQDKLTVICKDVLKADFPRFDLVVANIPYNISSPLVAKLVYGANTFRSATLLVQKEFARRLLAKPGDSEFNRLAVNVNLLAEIEFVMDVSKRDFLPCPKVDSSVVIIRPKDEVPEVDFNEWRAFTRCCFSKKNKTLGATFKQKRKITELLRISDPLSSNDKNSSSPEYDCTDDDCDGESDEDRRSSSSNTEMVVSLFKQKVIGVLRSGGFEGKRPSKLSNEELLHLLSLFNQAGIYFHGEATPSDANIATFVNSD